MIRGLYSAATALDSASQNQDIISQNLANANLPGYRRRGLVFEQFLPQLVRQSPPSPTEGDLYGNQISQAYTEFTPGPLEFTGNPFDLALKGDGFFVVQGPNGPLYTRNGSFTLDTQGQLRTTSGYLVAGNTLIPPAATRISVGDDGTVLADNVPVGQIQVVTFRDPLGLGRVGPTLFEAPRGVPTNPSTATVAQGYREGSNTNVVNELVGMVLGSRYYEAASRAVRALSDAIQQQTRPQQG
jgi:flagellar basal body rod protein FlgG